jgi:hypothetical protein
MRKNKDKEIDPRDLKEGDVVFAKDDSARLDPCVVTKVNTWTTTLSIHGRDGEAVTDVYLTSLFDGETYTRQTSGGDGFSYHGYGPFGHEAGEKLVRSLRKKMLGIVKKIAIVEDAMKGKYTIPKRKLSKEAKEALAKHEESRNFDIDKFLES